MPSSQTFLRELDKTLWTAADKLRSNLDAAVYKHAVLGLIFLKYVSDSFAQRQAEIEAMVRDPENDFYVPADGYKSPAAYEEAIRAELEERDYYIEKNVFWVPALARWKTLQDSAKLPAGTEIVVKGAQASCLSLPNEKATEKMKDTGKMDTKTGKYVYGYAKHMRDALPGASFIGFTGTPIEKADANTQETFGGYVSIYDIEDAKEDKATVPIYYESRLAKLDINREEIDRLNKDVEEVIEDEEDVSARESTKGKWAELAKLVGAKERVEEIAADWSGDLIVPIFV